MLRRVRDVDVAVSDFKKLAGEFRPRFLSRPDVSRLVTWLQAGIDGEEARARFVTSVDRGCWRGRGMPRSIEPLVVSF